MNFSFNSMEFSEKDKKSGLEKYPSKNPPL